MTFNPLNNLNTLNLSKKSIAFSRYSFCLSDNIFDADDGKESPEKSAVGCASYGIFEDLCFLYASMREYASKSFGTLPTSGAIFVVTPTFSNAFERSSACSDHVFVPLLYSSIKSNISEKLLFFPLKPPNAPPNISAFLL